MSGDPGRASVPSGEGHRRSRSAQLNLPSSGSPTRGWRQIANPSERQSSLDSHLVAPAARSVIQVGERNGASGASLSRWEAAVGNIEDAKVAFDALAKAIDEAIYLDEDAYNQVLPTMQFTKVIQAQQRRIDKLEAELRDTKFQLEESNAVQTEALQRHTDMQQELENNAVVFKMHYQELLAKDEEIQKLTAVIQALSGR